jgi:hypothetical protein
MGGEGRREENSKCCKKNWFKKGWRGDWGYGSVVEHLPSMCKAWIPSIGLQKKLKQVWKYSV